MRAFLHDGKHILYVSSRTTGFQLYRIDRVGNHSQREVSTPSNSSDPRWRWATAATTLSYKTALRRKEL